MKVGLTQLVQCFVVVHSTGETSAVERGAKVGLLVRIFY